MVHAYRLYGINKSPFYIDWLIKITDCSFFLNIIILYSSLWNNNLETIYIQLIVQNNHIELHHFHFKFKKVKTKFKNRNFKFKKLKSKFKNHNFKFKKLKSKFKNRNFKFKKLKSKFKNRNFKFKKVKSKFKIFLLTWILQKFSIEMNHFRVLEHKFRFQKWKFFICSDNYILFKTRSSSW